jgi:hypothetical protein
MFDSDPGEIPRGLDTMEPGPALSGFLASIDVAKLSGHDRIVVLRAHQRMASHYAARVYQDMTSVVDALVDLDDNPYMAPEWAAAEIRAALRLTRRTADSELAFALDLRRRLPRVHDALACGDIDVRRARTITSATGHLPVAVARDVVDQIIGDAPGLTTGQLAARLRRLCIETNPDNAADQYAHAVAERRIVTVPNPEGTSNLYGADLPPDRVAAATDRINQIARSLRRAGETRSMDQLRADVYLDLLEGTDGAALGTAKGAIDIRVDLTTLAELEEAPGELAGYGPVIADIARQVAAQQRSEWRFTVTEPDTGQPLHTGITRRRPTAGQRRAVHARNASCVFPGCRMPATGCDLDHRTPWADGGETTIDNLAPLCRHDRLIRHQAGWIHRSTGDQDHVWASPLGHTYTTSGTPP